MTNLEQQLQASVEATEDGGRFELRAGLVSDEDLADVHRQLDEGIERRIVWVPADWF
jgi:hypothetical protein